MHAYLGIGKDLDQQYLKKKLFLSTKPSEIFVKKSLKAEDGYKIHVSYLHDRHTCIQVKTYATRTGNKNITLFNRPLLHHFLSF